DKKNVGLVRVYLCSPWLEFRSHFQILQNIVVQSALVGVEGVVAGGGEPFAGGGFDTGNGGLQIAGGERLGHAGLHGLAQFLFDGYIHDALQVRTGKAVGLFGQVVEVDVLNRFAFELDAQDAGAGGGVGRRDEEDAIETAGTAEGRVQVPGGI